MDEGYPADFEFLGHRKPLVCSLTSGLCPSHSPRGWLAGQVCQYAGPALYPVSHFDPHDGAAVQQNVDTRSELDQSHSFSAFNPIAYLFVEDDPACQQPRYLFEDYRLSVAFDRDRILFVEIGGGGVHGVEIFSLLILNFADHARQWRAIDVYVEHAEKNTNPGALN